MKIYKKNRLDEFSIPYYRRLSFYLLISSVVLILTSIMMSILEAIKTYVLPIFIASLIIFLILLLTVIVTSYNIISKHKGYYMKARPFEKRITTALIDTMQINQVKQLSKIKVPDVFVDFTKFRDDKTIRVEIERLAGMDDVTRLIPLVSNSFNTKVYRNFAVVDYLENDNKMDFVFVLEDVKIDKTLVPQQVSDLLIDDLYQFKLQEGLTWDLIKYCHLICSGKTGSGKSTLLQSLLIQSLTRQIETYLVDPKREFATLRQAINEPHEVLELLEQLVAQMEQREREISSKVTNFGQTAKDLGYPPVMIFIDEVTALVAAFDNKEHKQFEKLLRKLILKGRALGYNVVLMAQNFNSETLSVAIRNQPNVRIILGQNSAEDYKFIFGSNTETVSDGLVPKFTGYYLINGLTNTPQRFYVPNLHKYRLNDVKYFKQ
jgi:putative transposon protein